MKNPAMVKNVFSIIGMVVGVVMVIVGFTMGTDLHGVVEPKLTYGGDAYTGIQNAAAATSQGVADAINVLNALNSHLGTCLSLIGALTVCLFGSKLDFGAFGNAKTADTAPAEADAQVGDASEADAEVAAQPAEPGMPVAPAAAGASASEQAQV